MIVGKILSIEKHPDADKLVVCQVDVGSGEPIQIVTGATNLTVGDVVPVAMDNSTPVSYTHLFLVVKRPWLLEPGPFLTVKR